MSPHYKQAIATKPDFAEAHNNLRLASGDERGRNARRGARGHTHLAGLPYRRGFQSVPAVPDGGRGRSSTRERPVGANKFEKAPSGPVPALRGLSTAWSHSVKRFQPPTEWDYNAPTSTPAIRSVVGYSPTLTFYDTRCLPLVTIDGQPVTVIDLSFAKEEPMSEARTKKAPLHLWIVGILALLWSLLGAADYIMTETHNEAYMSKFTPEQLEFFYGFPAWLVAFWAIAVWGEVLGAVLLLLRKRLALHALVVSFLCMAVTMIHDYGFAGAADIVGGVGIVFGVIAFVVALALILYARSMARKGILV